MLTVTHFDSTQSLATFSSFPAGERNLKISRDDNYNFGFDDVMVRLDYQSDQDLWDLALLCDAYSLKSDRIHLQIPYLPYARQDRACNEGEPHSLRVLAKFLNGLSLESIEIWDPHSDVVEALFDPRKTAIMRQWDCAFELLEPLSGTHLISPDAGAEKKTRKLGELINSAVFQCSKVRQVRTGEITGVSLGEEFENVPLDYKGTFIVVDDICDGGRTFTEIAKKVKWDFPQCKLDLYVTHGIFSKGLGVFEGVYENIFCPNVMNESVKDQFVDGVCVLNTEL